MDAAPRPAANPLSGQRSRDPGRVGGPAQGAGRAKSSGAAAQIDGAISSSVLCVHRQDGKHAY